MSETAIILCEGFFGTNTAKTTTGLLRYSERFDILGVIDSQKAGKRTADLVSGVKDVRIYKDLEHALSSLEIKPNWLIVGVATVGGKLPDAFREQVKKALEGGISIISGLHQYLGDDEEFKTAARLGNAKIIDIRRPPPLDKLHHFTNRVSGIDALRIPVLGTDSSIGKRTTALILARELNSAGIKTNVVATGQTGLLQGLRYGIPLDAIMSDYMVGELEHQILLAYDNEKPQVILIEGQGSISHPAYVCGSRTILSASQPEGVILQHAPGRKFRHYRMDELHWPMPDVETEMKLIKDFSGADVIAITVNDQEMHPSNLDVTISGYEKRFGIPSMNPLVHGCPKLVGKIKEMLQS